MTTRLVAGRVSFYDTFFVNDNQLAYMLTWFLLRDIEQ